MAMPKARLVIKVERDDSAADGRGVMVTVKEGQHGDYGDPYKVSLNRLTGSELMRVGAHLAANGYAFGDSRNMDQAQRLQRIESIVKSEGYAPREFEPKPRAEREALQPPATPQPERVNTPRPKPVAMLIDALPESGDEPENIIQHGDTMPAPIEPAPTYAPGSLEAIIADIASRVSPKVDTATITAEVQSKVLDEVRSHIAEIDALPRRVVIVTPTIEKELDRLSHHLLPDVVTALAAGNHVFLTGPAGSGKSTIAEQAFSALGKTYNPMSCDPSMMRTAIFGFVDANGNYHGTPARYAYEADEGGLLVDEMDNGHPSILAGMNQMLANGSCSFADRTVIKGAGFACIATANTWGLGATAEYVGRNPIDAATLDRFTVRFFVDYDAKMERLAALQYASDSTHASVSEWIDYAQGLRRRVMTAGVKVLVTPRATIAGAKLITAGVDLGKVKEWTVLAGMTDEIRGKVEA